MPSRRDFLIGAASLAVAPLAAQQTFDLAIANGRVVDPESGVDGIRHIGVTNGRIAVITPDRLTARATIDATGLVVCPGFIDLHAHQPDAGDLPLSGTRRRDDVARARGGDQRHRRLVRRAQGREGSSIYGVSIGHIPVRMAVMQDPGAFFPPAMARTARQLPAEIKEIAQRIADGPEEGRREHRRGFRLHARGNATKSSSRSFVSRPPLAATIHVHTRRGVAGLDEALRLAASDEGAAPRRPHQQSPASPPRASCSR